MLNEFNEGGTHDQNPLGGIPMGNGNSVEQGETKKDDFIYSDRITLSPNMISQFNLPKSLSGKTVADATKLINNKFKDRTSKIDESTKKSFLDRIANAQETIKAEQQAELQAKMQMNSEDVPDMMGGQAPQRMEQFMQQGQPQQQMFDGGSLNGYANLATTSMDLGNQMFGKSGINSSGSQDVDPSQVKPGMMGLDGAMKGAQAGMMFGPLGAGIGGAVGLTAGLIGGNRAKKDAMKGHQNFQIGESNGLISNFAMGGKMYSSGGPFDIVPKQSTRFDDPNYGGEGPEGFFKPSMSTPSFNPNFYKDKTNVKGFQDWMDKSNPNWLKNGKSLNKGAGYGNVNGPQTQQAISKFGQDYYNSGIPLANNPQTPVYQNRTPGLLEASTNTQPYQYPTTSSSNENWYDTNKPGMGYDQNQSTNSKFKEFLSKTGNNINENAGNVMRYAPVAMNALQLKNLNKQGYDTVNPIINNDRYNPQYMDEKALTNQINSESNYTANALANATNGSLGALSNNILGSQLNKTKALSDAYSKVADVNRNENRTAQQFNLGINETNIGRRVAAEDKTAMNKGAFNTEKSKLQAQIGNDLGNIGKEQVYKKLAKEAFGYTYDGKYVKDKQGNTVKDPTTGEPLTQEQLNELQGKSGKDYKKVFNALNQNFKPLNSK